MSDEVANRAAIETFWRLWNEERLDEAMGMYAPDACLHHLNHGTKVIGSENIGNLMAWALAAFPGRRSDVLRVFAVGDDVITENHWQGTSADVIEYGDQAVPPGQHMTRDICYIFHFVDGKIAEQREYG